MFSFDIHFHFFPQTFVDEARIPGNPFQTSINVVDGVEHLICRGDFDHPLENIFYTPERIIADMDARQLKMSAISSAPPTLSYWVDGTSTGRLASNINNEIAQRLSDNPDRFLGLGTVPLQDIDQSIREAHRAVRDLGLHGFMIGSNVEGKNLNHPDFFPFFETIEELDVPLFIHPYLPAGAERMQDYYLHNLVGMVSETGLAISSVIFGGILERLPNLRLCFAHAGGVFPYIVGRQDQGYRVREVECSHVIPKPPSHYFPMLYFDSITFHPQALRYLIDLVGVDRIMIGSDYPFDMGPEQQVLEILDNPYLNKHEKKMIVGENAKNFFRL
jgi:aminocarboxymuconate-semialdehyde decarboxylase